MTCPSYQHIPNEITRLADSVKARVKNISNCLTLVFRPELLGTCEEEIAAAERELSELRQHVRKLRAQDRPNLRRVA